MYRKILLLLIISMILLAVVHIPLGIMEHLSRVFL